MAKHVNIPLHNSIATARIDVERFAAFVHQLNVDPRSRMSYPQSWLSTSLLSRTHDGRVEVTPRGEDLLASMSSLPDDPVPDVKTTPCSKCNGAGELPLFTSMYACDRCGGNKVEPEVYSGIKLVHAWSPDDETRFKPYTPTSHSVDVALASFGPKLGDWQVVYPTGILTDNVRGAE